MFAPYINQKIIPILDRDIDRLDRIIEEKEEFDDEILEFISYLISPRKEETQTQYYKRLDSYFGLIKVKQYLSKFRDEEAKRLKELSRTDANVAKKLQKRMLVEMEILGITKIETDRYKASISNNGGALPLDIDENITVDQIPQEYLIVRYDLNTDKIRSDLEDGKLLSFARLKPRGKHLRIK
jgi:hypothetical protein